MLIPGDYKKCNKCGWENNYDREYCDNCGALLLPENIIYDMDKRIEIKQNSVNYIRIPDEETYLNGQRAYICPVCGWSYIDYTTDFCELCYEDLHKYDIPKSEFAYKQRQERYGSSLIEEVSKILAKKKIISKKKTEKRKEQLQRAVESYNNDELDGTTRHISNKVRTEVWNRNNGRCSICGSQKFLEFDHIIPFSKGGKSVAENIQLLCQKCNRKKSNKIPFK